MSETTKHDYFMEELNSLEKRIYVFVQKHEEVLNENSELKALNKKLEKENEVLNLKLEELEEKLNEISEGELSIEKIALDPDERKNLKNKIGELISKIDYHLRS